MKVLVLESHPDHASEIASLLVEEGHSVVRCTSAGGHDESDAAHVACRGLDDRGSCPLEWHEGGGAVDVAVVAHQGEHLTADEHGALCAMRDRVPVVFVGDPARGNPFGAAVLPAGDASTGPALSSVLARAAGDGSSHEAAIRRDLVARGVLSAGGDGVSFAVEREPRRLVLTVHIDPAHPRHAAVVKASAEAIRRFDRSAQVIDVRVMP
jgi:hypothetical protein